MVKPSSYFAIVSAAQEPQLTCRRLRPQLTTGQHVAGLASEHPSGPEAKGDGGSNA